jgi:hypothetical protein
MAHIRFSYQTGFNLELGRNGGKAESQVNWQSDEMELRLLVAVEKQEWTCMLVFLMGLLLFWCLRDFAGGRAIPDKDEDASEVSEEMQKDAEDNEKLYLLLSCCQSLGRFWYRISNVRTWRFS